MFPASPTTLQGSTKRPRPLRFRTGRDAAQSRSAQGVASRPPARINCRNAALSSFPCVWGFAVLLLDRMRRVQCGACGVKVEQVPWAMGKHTLTQVYLLYLAHWARKLSWAETARSFHTRWEKVGQAVEPIKKFARTIRRHRELLLNYFRARKAFSSGVIEGLNNKAKVTMRKAYGFRTFGMTEIALYHALGKLPEPQLTHRFY